MRSMLGDQTGRRLLMPAVVTCLSFVPSRPIVKTCSLPVASSRTNAYRHPSGDQAGSPSHVLLWVTLSRPLPSAFMNTTSALLDPFGPCELKMIRWPFADQCGE